MVQPILVDQYTAARTYFASIVGLLVLESLVHLPTFLMHKLSSDASQVRRSTSHWKLTVAVHRYMSLPVTIPYFTSYHVADALRFTVFATLNIIFSLNHNDYTSDFTLYGWLTLANGGLTLLLAPRTNLFALLWRIPSPILLQYHRWIGLATVVDATVHISFNIQHYIRTEQVATSFVATRIQAGIMAWLCLAIIFLTSLSFMRRQRFEIFYYAHFLFIAFVIGALIHTSNGPEFLLPGFCLWGVDRMIRFAYNFRQVRVQSMTQYDDGNVTKLKVENIKISEPGQIVFMQIPSVSWLNWHPFTVAAAPGDSVATIAIRGLGGFTTRVQAMPKGDDSSDTMPTLRVRADGPYGVGRIQWGSLPLTVLVAGGIGITPALSIASHVIKRAKNIADSSLQASMHIHLLWIVKEWGHVSWFSDELSELQHLCADANHPISFNITIHCTSKGGSLPAKVSTTTGLGELPKAEANTLAEPLSSNWNMCSGRPDLRTWIRQLKADFPDRDAGINVCGPRSLITELRRAASAASDDRGIMYVEEEVFEF